MASIVGNVTQPNNFYTPLNEADEIRLVRLHPLSSDGSISCSIEHAKLSEKLPYEALSYMWGAEKNMKTIEIDGVMIGVRENLWHALCCLAPATGSWPKVIWIDAVCINQDDHNEKGHQIEQMGEIYGQARMVVVWLGLSDVASRKAFNVLSNPGCWGGLLQPSVDPSTENIINENLRALQSVFQRDYWERLWIIQEVLMAAEILVLCGKDYCDWFRVSWLLSTISGRDKISRAKSEDFRQRESIVSTIQNTIPARLAHQRHHNRNNYLGARNYEPKFCPLLILFDQFGEAECQDPLDKIFGLLSLAEPCCRHVINANYSSTWTALYDNMLKHHILHHKMVTLRTFGDYWGFSSTVNRDSSLVGNTQKQQAKLGVTSKYCMKTKISIGFAINQEEVASWLSDKMNGYARGHISYISPRISALRLRLTNSILPSELTERVEIQLDYILRVGRLDENQSLLVTRELDNVQYFGDNRSGAFSAKGGTWVPHPKREDFIFPERNFISKPSKTKALRNLRQMLQSAHQRIPKPMSKLCCIAFDHNGLIAFVPPETQVGDVLCQFPGSNILAILREDPDFKTRDRKIFVHNYPDNYIYYRFVGRAVNYLPSLSTIPIDICGRTTTIDDFKNDVRLYQQIEFKLDLRTLYMLTSAPATPDPENEVP